MQNSLSTESIDKSGLTNKIAIIAKPVKNLILIYRKKISFGLVIICIIVIIINIFGFIENGQHDGFPSLLISIVSYITTTTALVTALLFLI
jgi:hypothetical protein